MLHDWRGPMVVQRQRGTSMEPQFYENVKAEDLRVAVDYLLEYGRHFSL